MPQRGAGKATNNGSSADVINDPRFASFATDPRFRLPSKKHSKTKIDKRFSRMLKDDDFLNKAKVDRYGRKIEGQSNAKKTLRRLYEAEDDDEESDNEEEGEKGIEIEDDDVVTRELDKAEKAYDPARGGGFSSSDEEDDYEEEDNSGLKAAEGTETEAPAIDIEQGDIPTGEVSSRLAIVNLDWDNVKSSDLLAVFSSFVPTGGRIEKISVYPSEFGKERMEREELDGPPKELFKKRPTELEAESESDDSDTDDGEDEDLEDERDDDEVDEEIKKALLKEDKGDEFDSTALRQYQLERLRYYYAVMVCSNAATARHIYETTDGTEYLSSANYFDLRFIPDDVDFDDTPRDECTKVPLSYRPTDFVTDALTHSKVKMTWDGEDTQRKETLSRAFTGSRSDINENDLRAYLGSDSSSDEDEEAPAEKDDQAQMDVPILTKKELARRKMRAALGLADEPVSSSKKSQAAPVGDMEITFTAGLSGKGGGNVFENEPILVETTAEAYVRKERERKARRKEKAKSKRENGEEPANPAEAAQDSKEIESKAGADDLGFDDLFFSAQQDETQKSKSRSSLTKEERRAKREAKEKEEKESLAKRQELELLMTDDEMKAGGGDSAEKLGHFDINEIARAEKTRKKKGKSKTRKDLLDEKGGKRGGLQEDFNMDVHDPRFTAIYQNHEFAIDPSNPRFKGTGGMKQLLEEGRQKRNSRFDDGTDEIMDTAKNGKVKSRKRKDEEATRDGDLSGLVEAVKKKSRK